MEGGDWQQENLMSWWWRGAGKTQGKFDKLFITKQYFLKTNANNNNLCQHEPRKSLTRGSTHCP